MFEKQSLIPKARQIDTTVIADARKGTTRVVAPEIVCRSSNPVMFGFAYTVKADADILAGLHALGDLKENDVLVIDGGSLPIAYAGEIFARDVERIGVAGIIVDGGHRDIPYIRTSSFPVFSRFAVPHAGPAKQTGESGIPVNIGGVTINPGDFIVSDANGIVVLDVDEADAILDDAIAIKAAEAKVIAGMDSGKRLRELSNVEEHFAATERGEESTFSWKV